MPTKTIWLLKTEPIIQFKVHTCKTASYKGGYHITKTETKIYAMFVSKGQLAVMQNH